MLEIVLAATTGLGVLGMGWLMLQQRRRYADLADDFASYVQRKALQRERHAAERATLEEQHAAALKAAIDHYEREATAQRSQHFAALEAQREDYSYTARGMASQIAALMAAADAANTRYQALVGGHEFHKGGKVAAHGCVSVLYNCVTCPPEANVRLLAPRGFFAEEVADDGEAT